MNYIVFDLEWNQAADLRTRRANSLLFEIIEIGAVKLNEKKEQIDDFHELIKPQVFHTMNQVTGDLIHLKMEQLEDCRSFPEVAADFVQWCGSDFIFCTWGTLDLTELQKNMDYYNMTPVSEKTLQYYDVQKLFSIAFEDRKSRRTLQYAVDFLHIRKDVDFHRAYTDAYYTAEVIKRIGDDRVFRNYSFDTYHMPRNKSEEIKICFEDYAKYISRELRTSLPPWEIGRSRQPSAFCAARRPGKKSHGLPVMENITIPLYTVRVMVRLREKSGCAGRRTTRSMWSRQ